MITGRSVSEQMIRGGASILVAVLIWFLPSPAGVTARAWHLLALFAGTVAGLILDPLPMGAVVITGTMATALTGTLSPAEALNGFANTTVWLIFAAFLFARGFIKTGLGRRIAYCFIRAFGRRTLGLAYALELSDLVVAPATPSNTARAGGVLFPIVRGLVATHNSEPGPTANRIGRFLMLTMDHGCLDPYRGYCGGHLGCGDHAGDRALTWDDVLTEKGGWNALIWFGGLVGMDGMLSQLGLTKWFSGFVAGYVKGWPLLPALVVLLLVYNYSHYAFATLTVHVTALYVPFPIYYGAGYVSLNIWWGIGFLASVVNLVIWLGIGSFYWKALGLF